MFDKESIKKQYREIFKSWGEGQLDEFAEKKARKYSTIKKGDNVIHLEYYERLIDSNDIHEIESIFSEVGLELSRFDATGELYASIEEYILQCSISLNDPIVQSILLGLGVNATWDAIKKTSILIWKKLKKSHPTTKRNKLNFGLRIQIKNKVEIQLKLDGDFEEKIISEAIDKIIDLVKNIEDKDNAHVASNFFVFNKVTKKWSEVDIKE